METSLRNTVAAVLVALALLSFSTGKSTSAAIPAITDVVGARTADPYVFLHTPGTAGCVTGCFLLPANEWIWVTVVADPGALVRLDAIYDGGSRDFFVYTLASSGVAQVLVPPALPGEGDISVTVFTETGSTTYTIPIFDSLPPDPRELRFDGDARVVNLTVDVPPGDFGFLFVDLTAHHISQEATLVVSDLHVSAPGLETDLVGGYFAVAQHLVDLGFHSSVAHFEGTVDSAVTPLRGDGSGRMFSYQGDGGLSVEGRLWSTLVSETPTPVLAFATSAGAMTRQGDPIDVREGDLTDGAALEILGSGISRSTKSLEYQADGGDALILAAHSVERGTGTAVLSRDGVASIRQIANEQVLTILTGSCNGNWTAGVESPASAGSDVHFVYSSGAALSPFARAALEADECIPS